MEHWSAGEDRPYLRHEPPQSFWWLWALIALLVGVGVAYYFWYPRADPWPPPAPLAMPGPPPAEAPPAEPSAEAQIKHPVPSVQQAPATPLPKLDNSDAMMRDTVTGLVGRKAFDAMVRPTELIRRIVATVDNLPRETASRRMLPLEQVPGQFAPDAANAARYTPYVRVMESLDARAVVQRYFQAYPLFQRAYVELGYPKGNFNDRLVEAIDDLLAAPELGDDVELVQPKVQYQFADPGLERLSAGQKIMLRMGAANAARVKAKLRELRRELAKG
jgi:hypothetical protein